MGSACARTGWNALHIASHRGHLAVVEALLASGVFDVFAGTECLASGADQCTKFSGTHRKGAESATDAATGVTALHLAAQRGHENVVRVLIRAIEQRLEQEGVAESFENACYASGCDAIQASELSINSPLAARCSSTSASGCPSPSSSSCYPLRQVGLELSDIILTTEYYRSVVRTALNVRVKKIVLGKMLFDLVANIGAVTRRTSAPLTVTPGRPAATENLTIGTSAVSRSRVSTSSVPSSTKSAPGASDVRVAEDVRQFFEMYGPILKEPDNYDTGDNGAERRRLKREQVRMTKKSARRCCGSIMSMLLLGFGGRGSLGAGSDVEGETSSSPSEEETGGRTTSGSDAAATAHQRLPKEVVSDMDMVSPGCYHPLEPLAQWRDQALGRTALHIAVMHGWEEVLQKCLSTDIELSECTLAAPLLECIVLSPKILWSNAAALKT